MCPDPLCDGCGKRPEVYGSSWCAHCHDSLPEYTKARIIRMSNALHNIKLMGKSKHFDAVGTAREGLKHERR